MKILYYFNSMAPAGGIERVLAKHIDFNAPMVDSVLLTKDEKPSFYPLPDGVRRALLHIDFSLDMTSRFKRMVKVASLLAATALRLKKVLAAERPDVVYVASPLNLLEVFLAGWPLSKILVTEHSSYTAYNTVYRSIIRLLYKRVGLLLVPTTRDSEIYSSLGIVNVYLPNPLPFYPERCSPLDSKIVLNVGRLTDDKRHRLLIEMWARSEGPQAGWTLRIIGKGENQPQLQALIQALGLQESVTICPPTIQIVDEYLGASVFLLTSRAEGFGLVLAEAMACGIPCVAFDCPSGPRDIIRNSEYGFLITEGDLSGYIRKLNILMLDRALRREVGGAARVDILRFKDADVAQKFSGLVKSHFQP